ncbi:NadS family protein [Pseudohongiella nitratireducens]|uniref:NadS family protein n=1 Tax=Pseudohongiella nitratireducens TaxID=1768907 RepID=UPI00240A7248|nr:NadS family protein [Pseudohongiella nitratireducens]MDF1623514.1 NadS family protein [Pseudohongiella nitratireducens]|tara:strand:+ start:1146 stop:1430 length:285 start_codon:yes stop_codon:yes gene_type:complete
MSEQYDSLRAGLEEAIAWKKGKKTGAKIRVYTAMDVAKIRKKTKMTQKSFADAFGIPLSTLRQWEQGQRVPRGPAQALLKIIDNNAKVALKALS